MEQTEKLEHNRRKTQVEKLETNSRKKTHVRISRSDKM